MKFSEKLWKHFSQCVKIFDICAKVQNIGCDKMKYNFNKSGISEGIEFCSISAEGFKSSCISVNFVLPLGEKASLYALVPNVLTRSSEKYPDLASIERKLANLYGADLIVDVSKVGENQILKLEVSCIDDRFALENEVISAECSKLLFELIFKPNVKNGAFSQHDTESEKRLLIERLYAEQSDKRSYAKNKCEELMFSEEAYGIHRFGTVEGIEKITPENLYEAYCEILRTAKIVVCSSGNTDANRVCEEFKAYSNKLSRELCLGETLFVEKSEDVQYVKEQEPVKQGKLVMGFRMGMTDANDNYAARRVMVDLFGGSPHSKLFTVVREKMSLCYYCSARMIRAKGIMFVQSGIESFNEDKAKEAILGQLEDVKNGNFSQDDIDASVKALEDSFKSVTDSPESLDSWFMSQCVSGAYKYPEDFINDFKNVTKEEIMKAAQDVTLDTVFMLEGTAKESDSNE